jgi:hypothetical protein
MADGTLTEPAFRHYLVQDYLFFLIEFARAYALAVYKSLQLADTLLAFDDFPAEHWKHLRTTNPIESTFATVRHRTIRSKGLPLEQDGACNGVQAGRGRPEKLRRLDGHNQLPKVIERVKFTDGIEAVRQDAQAAAAWPKSPPRFGDSSMAAFGGRVRYLHC